MSDPALNLKITVSGATQGAAEVEKLASASGKVADSAGKAAPQAKGLAEALTGLGSRNNQAKDVLEGIDAAAKGGSGSLFGLAKAGKNLIEVFSGFTPLGRLVSILGLVTGGFLALKDTLYPTQKAIDANNSSADQLKDTFGQLEKAAKSSLDNQLKDVNNLKEGFDDLVSAADRARERMDKINGAKTRKALADIDENEAKALAVATTDEQRAKIKSTASGQRDTLRDTSALAKIADDQDNARNRVKQGEDALAPLRGQIYTAASERDRANQELADAKSTLVSRREAGIALDSSVMKELREAVATAAMKAKLAGENFDKLSEAVSPQISRIEREIDKARLTLDVAPIEAQTLLSERRTRGINKTTETLTSLNAKKSALGEKATQSSAAGNDAAQDEAVAELKAVNAQIASTKAAPALAPEVQQLGQALSAKDDKVYQTMIGAQSAIQSVAGAQQALAGKYDQLQVQFNELARQVSNSRQ